MYKRIVSLIIALALLFSTVVILCFQAPSVYASSSGSLSSQESQVVALVNGTTAYNYDLELERIALNRSISNYAFRSAGSVGATATAMWLKSQFESFGLETHLESFEFTNWNLPSQPSMIVDDDGNINTVNDQWTAWSFQSEHYSWPTPEGGVFSGLVVLPLPNATNISEVGAIPIDTSLWDSINTSGKIVLIGREVRWNTNWEQTFKNKLSVQTPSAVVFTWWNQWMSFVPPFFSSSGGRPPSSWGPYFWDLKIPVGWVSYEDGLLIRDKESSMNIWAKVTIPSVIGSGTHYNVVARFQGNVNASKFVIVSGHYDTVMTAGLVDNGAGTSGVLELARVFAEAEKRGVYRPDYTILFIGFASEELGLVGSTHYVMQHKADMKDIVAVINLDSIGSQNLNVARTDPQGGLDLDERVLQAARDLNVSAAVTEPGGSDQEIFRNPVEGDSIYSYWWPRLSAGISNAVPVLSSTMLVSSPLVYSDQWSRGSPGWIHTSYDNSTSGQTLNWFELSSFEEQIRVAALSVMRVSPSSQGVVAGPYSLPWWTYGLAIVVVAAVAVTVVYFVKLRKRPVKDVVQ